MCRAGVPRDGFHWTAPFSEHACAAQVWPEGRTGIELSVEGFSHKLGLLTRAIIHRLATLHTQARPPRLNSRASDRPFGRCYDQC